MSHNVFAMKIGDFFIASHFPEIPEGRGSKPTQMIMRHSQDPYKVGPYDRYKWDEITSISRVK